MSEPTAPVKVDPGNRWYVALAIWFVVHIAVVIFVPATLRYVFEPGWWLAVYFGYRIGGATPAGGGE